MAEEIRKFETGATRDTDTTKPDFDGFLSPLVIARYGEYMHKNRVQKDGTLRASDNWTKGIPFSAYMKSGWRHFFAWWGYDRGVRPSAREGMVEEALLGLLFNASGYLHEVLKARRYEPELEWDSKPKGLHLDPGNLMLTEKVEVPRANCVPLHEGSLASDLDYIKNAKEKHIPKFTLCGFCGCPSNNYATNPQHYTGCSTLQSTGAA